ncbi:hypothetical protein GF323_06155 [Candidatus Woesearchaeota archaeon]|nr:hypothetical protein [Candidatus Woesearchaeota archaeon]
MAESNIIGSYIEGFDQALGGGIPKNHIVMIYGSAGTMKSSLCFNILYNEILKGKKGVYVSIEQNSLSLLRQMVSLGFDISKVNIEVLNDAQDILRGLSKLKDDESKKLTIVDLGSIRKQLKGKSNKNKKGTADFAFGPDMITTILKIAETLKSKKLCDILVLDSLTAIYSLTQIKEVRSDIFYLFEFFRDIGVTTFVISEESEINPNYTRIGIESYLVDGIIHLQLTERNRKVTREISVVKMRSTDCNNDVFTLEFGKNKFKALYGGKMPLV